MKIKIPVMVAGEAMEKERNDCREENKTIGVGMLIKL